MGQCKCGCGAPVPENCDFIDKSHQKAWRLAEEEKLWSQGANASPLISERSLQKINSVFTSIGNSFSGLLLIAISTGVFVSFIYIITRFVKWSWQQ